MANESIKNAFSRFWEHTLNKINDVNEKVDELATTISWNDLNDRPFWLEENALVEMVPETAAVYNGTAMFDGLNEFYIDAYEAIGDAFDSMEIKKYFNGVEWLYSSEYGFEGFNFVEGAFYQVRYNGVDYDVQFQADLPFLGNASLLGLETNPDTGKPIVDTGEPFVIPIFDVENVIDLYVWTQAGEDAQITLAISKYHDLYHTVDNRYLDLHEYLTYDKAASIYQRKGDYVTNYQMNSKLNSYATKSSLNNYQPKGDYLTEHQPIKTINGESVVGDGNIRISDISRWSELEGRPFYTEYSGELGAELKSQETVSIPESNYPYETENTYGLFLSDVPWVNLFLHELKIGETYAIKVNDTVYLCECIVTFDIDDYNGTMYLGNLSLDPGNDETLNLKDTGEPFNIAADIDSYRVIWKKELGDTITISAYEADGEIHPLDEKYLPDTVATKEYVRELIGAIENGTY